MHIFKRQRLVRRVQSKTAQRVLCWSEAGPLEKNTIGLLVHVKSSDCTDQILCRAMYSVVLGVRVTMCHYYVIIISIIPIFFFLLLLSLLLLPSLFFYSLPTR